MKEKKGQPKPLQQPARARVLLLGSGSRIVPVRAFLPTAAFIVPRGCDSVVS